MVEALRKHLIGTREQGPDMRLSDRGANTVAVRVLPRGGQWATNDLAA